MVSNWEITDKLYAYVKAVLLSRPLDIYDPDDETVQEAAFELVESRKSTKKIGSANMAIVYSILREDMIENSNCFDLSEDQVDYLDKTWELLFEKLEQEKFLTRIPEPGLKLVVDNTNVNSAN